jgi:hypothetical protein
MFSFALYSTCFRRNLRTQGITVKMCGYKVQRRVLSVTKFKWAGNRGNYRLIQEKFVVCSRVLSSARTVGGMENNAVERAGASAGVI